MTKSRMSTTEKKGDDVKLKSRHKSTSKSGRQGVLDPGWLGELSHLRFSDTVQTSHLENSRSLRICRTSFKRRERGNRESRVGIGEESSKELTKI